MFMKLKLAYSLDQPIQDELQYMKIILSQIGKKSEINIDFSKYRTFDEFINSNDKLKDIIKSTLGFTFILHNVSDFKLVVYDELHEDQKHMVQAIKCVDITGITVPDELCHKQETKYQNQN